MEKGIKISNLDPATLKTNGALAGALKKFDRFYIGAEFCENLLPRPEDLRRTAAFFLEKDRKVCVLTPPISERGVCNLKSAFRLLARLGPSALELTINDFGTLELARECGLPAKISAGRLLCGNVFLARKRTFQLINSQALRFFTAQGIDRFELSASGELPRTNFSCARSLGFAPGDLNLTLYYPYLNLTTTRTCLLGVPDIPPDESVTGIHCRRECEIASFDVKHPLVREPLLVHGNTVFMRFPRKFYSSENNLEAMRVNRLVYCPFP